MHCLGIILLLISLIFIASAQNSAAASYEERLESAFKNGSQEDYVKLLDSWVAQYPPVTEQILAKKPDFERHTYEIFQRFYTPKRLQRLAEPQWREVYEQVHYVLVQNSVRINFTECLCENDKGGMAYNHEKIHSRLHLLDFRPKIQVEGSQVLYLTEWYRDIFTAFLDDTEVRKDVESKPMSSDDADKRRKQKQEFLGTQTQVFPGHWGHGWHIETHPYVQSIIFNQEMTTAIVSFRILYRGGRAIFMRSERGWELHSSAFRWIE